MSETENQEILAPKKRRKRRKRFRSGFLFACAKVAILVSLIIMCAALRQLGKLHEKDCLWVKDLCGVITEVSIALLKGMPMEAIAVKASDPPEDKATSAR